MREHCYYTTDTLSKHLIHWEETGFLPKETGLHTRFCVMTKGFIGHPVHLVDVHTWLGYFASASLARLLKWFWMLPSGAEPNSTNCPPISRVRQQARMIRWMPFWFTSRETTPATGASRCNQQHCPWAHCERPTYIIVSIIWQKSYCKNSLVACM